MLIKLKLETDKQSVAELSWADPTYRKVGDITQDGATVYEITQTEVNTYVPKHTRFVDGHLVVDPNYEPPKPQPNSTDTTQAAIARQVASLTVANAAVAKQVADIEQKINKGDQ